MVSNKSCVICECTSGVMKPVLESLVPTTTISIHSPTGALKDMWTMFIRILTNSEDDALKQICIDCFGEIQRTYYFVDKCEKSQLKTATVISKTAEYFNKTPHYHRFTKATVVHEFPENLRSPFKLNRSNSFPELRSSNYEKESTNEQEVTQELSEAPIPAVSQNDHHSKELPLTEQNVDEIDTEMNASTTAGEDVEILWTWTVNSTESRTTGEAVNTELVCNINNETVIPIRHTAKSFEQPSGQPSEQPTENPSENTFEEEECTEIQYARILRSRKTIHELEHRMPKQKKSRRDIQNGKENSNLNNLNPFACAICLMNFRTRRNLRIHLLAHCKINSLECRCCSKIFLTETQLKRHMRCIHSTIKHVCKICSKVFSNVKLLLNHLKKSNCKSKTTPQFKCSICLKNFNSRPNLSQHMLTHSKASDNAFTCEICSNRYPNNGKLKMHLISHSNERTHDCYKCSKMFKFPQSLRVHIKLAHPELKHRCSVCLHMFEKLRELRLHKAMLHKYKCNICFKYFSSTSSFDEHMKHHPCRFCGEIFQSFPDFKKHMVAGLCVPDDKKNFQCFECWKIFSRKVDLSRHLFIHSNNISFKCEVCNVKFTRKDSLNRHKKKMHNL